MYQLMESQIRDMFFLLKNESNINFMKQYFNYIIVILTQIYENFQKIEVNWQLWRSFFFLLILTIPVCLSVTG